MTDDCIAQIDFLDVASIPKMIKDFLGAENKSYIHRNFSSQNALEQAKEKLGMYPDKNRLVLVDELRHQIGGSMTQRQHDNLQHLAKSNCVSVTTGHQLNLFTGCVFFLYKIIQTIKTARELSLAHPDISYVPIFWMASEDHDLEEADHFSTQNHYYQTQQTSGNAVGRIQIEDTYFMEQFEKEFQHDVYGTELILLLKKAYQKGNTFSQATRIVVQHLFGHHGLLILDADNVALKNLATPLWEKELFDNLLFESTKETREDIVSRYGKVQVNPREINLFYLDQTRNRIEKREDLFHVVDTDIVFTQEQIKQQLALYPERFSPNAVLRGAYQETILPNVAYIGGNAEIMYWMELKAYFEKINIAFPILIARNSVLCITEKQQRKIEKMNLDIADFFGQYHETIHHRLLEKTDLRETLSREESAMEKIFETLSEQAKQTDVTFLNLVQAEKTRQLKSFDRMNKRLLKAQKKKHQQVYDSYLSIYEQINPGGVWQERRVNFSSFYAENGTKWMEKCFENLPTDQTQLIVLSL